MTLRPPGKANAAPADAERGLVAAEMVLLTPVLAALLVFVVFVGRSAAAANDVGQAAAAAARTATLHGSPTQAVAAARGTATANLAASGVDCATASVDVAADTRPGGTVVVDVDCTVAYTDLAIIALPGTRTFTGRAVEVVDTYRGGSP